MSKIQQKVEISKSNPLWPSDFESEAQKIREALGSQCLEIHHIGSTSVPGLMAKPIIDILPVVQNICDVNGAAMEALGFDDRGELGILFRRYFSKPGFHVHVYESGNPEITRHLDFRDRLRQFPEERRAYQELKLELATRHPNDRFAYTSGKSSFVRKINKRAGSNGHCIVHALTPEEWAAVRAFGGSTEAQEDPQTLHLVLLEAGEATGYAQLQTPEDQPPTLELLRARNKRSEALFRSELERWISKK